MMSMNKVSRMMSIVTIAAILIGLSRLIPLERIENDPITLGSMLLLVTAFRRTITIVAIGLEPMMIEGNAFGRVMIVIQLVLVGKSHSHITSLMVMMADLQNGLGEFVGRLVAPTADGLDVPFG